MRTILVLAGLALGALASAAAFIFAGFYDVAATRQHTRPVYWVSDTVMRYAIARRARGTPIPDLSDPARALRGLRLYREHCLQCHGAPGVAPEPFALGMMPVPANLVETARRWPTANLHWVIAYGVKMTGMPAWKYRLSGAEIWDVVAFVERMAQLTPNDYAALVDRADAAARRRAAAAPPREER